MNINFWHALLVFIVSAIADVTWAQWTLNANKHRAFAAAAWGVGIVVLGAVNVDAYVRSLWYVVPSAAGAFIGTYWIVLRENNNKQR